MINIRLRWNRIRLINFVEPVIIEIDGETLKRIRGYFLIKDVFFHIGHIVSFRHIYYNCLWSFLKFEVMEEFVSEFILLIRKTNYEFM
jgi:hypothetical protein